MNIETNNIGTNITYEHYINQPMRMCERKMNMNFVRNPQLINSLDHNKNRQKIFSHTI